MEKSHRCLVIDSGSNNNPKYRLPKAEEISYQVFRKAKKVNLISEAEAIITKTEISPWDLLDPFPTQDFYDYGYINLKNRSETNRYWHDLIEEDKILIQKVERNLIQVIG